MRPNVNQLYIKFHLLHVKSEPDLPNFKPFPGTERGMNKS